MPLKYIYSQQGLQESVILPIDFWNDLFSRFDLKDQLKNESYFFDKCLDVLENLEIVEKDEEAFFALCGSWQSDESGDELAADIYAARNDQEREVEL